MLVAKGTLAHISQLDSAFGTRVHEPIAARGVEFGSRDDFGELFHVRGLDIHNVETLVLNVEVPQVDAEIITADKRLSIAVNGYAVDVVGMGVGVGLPGYSCHDGIMMGETRQLQITGTLDSTRQRSRRSTSARDAARGRLARQVVFCDDFQRFLEDLPQLDGLVVSGEEVVGGVLSAAPLDLVDLLFDLEGLEIVEFGLVGLELCVELVLAGFFLC